MATILICGSGPSQSRPGPERCDHQWFGTFVATYHFMRIFNSWVEASSVGAPDAEGNAVDAAVLAAFRTALGRHIFFVVSVTCTQ